MSGVVELDATLGGVSTGQFPLFLLGLSYITVLADVNTSLGMPSIVALCSCSY